MRTPPPKSELKAFVAGGKIQFSDFISPRGPNGGRNVIRGFYLHFVGTATTVVGALPGEDKARLWSNIQISERSGLLRWNLPGDFSRHACHYLDGSDRVAEFADTGVGAGQTMDSYLYIPMAKALMGKRGDDYALPVDDFRMIEITMPALADFTNGGNSISAISGNYHVVVDVDEEYSVEAKLKDEVTFANFTSTTETRLALKGKLKDLFLCARGFDGGATLAAVPSVRIDELNMSILTRADLRAAYGRDRAQAPGLSTTQGAEMRSDPFRGTACIPVLWSMPEDSAVDGKLLDAAKVTLDGNAVASIVAVYRQVLPQSKEYLAELSGRFGVPIEAWQMKTENKSKQNPRAWEPELRPFIPKKAPLAGVARK